MRDDIRSANIFNPNPNPGGTLRGFYGRTLAGAMMASEALRKEAKDTVEQAESLLRRSDKEPISSAIETGLIEIRAFSAAFDAAQNAGLRNVASAVDYAVVKAVSESNPSIRRAMSEAESRPKLDKELVKELISMPVNRIVLLSESEAVEKAAMAMSYAAALYAKYFGVLFHLAGGRFKEWQRYALPVRTFWELFKKGYVVLGTALPESAEEGVASTPYVCAKLRDNDMSKGNGVLLEI